MAAITTIIAGIAAAAAVAGTGVAVAGQIQARKAASANRTAQENAANESRAQQAQAAAEDQRKQVREERVRRARIIQGSVNTGSNYSSGEEGALGALSTNLSGGLGANVGGVARAGRVGGYLQQAANANADIQRGQAMFQFGNQLASTGGSLFGQATQKGSGLNNFFDLFDE